MSPLMAFLKIPTSSLCFSFSLQPATSQKAALLETATADHAHAILCMHVRADHRKKRTLSPSGKSVGGLRMIIAT